MASKQIKDNAYYKDQKSFNMVEYPHLTCYWRVYFQNINISANEVSGLNEKIELMPYRNGNDSEKFNQIKKPNPQNSTLTIKWGIFTGGKNGAHIFQLWRDVRSYYNDWNSIDILVTLQDENDNEVLYWVCRNCIPVNYKGPTLNADKSEIAMQTLELSVESIRSYYVHDSAAELISYWNKHSRDNSKYYK